MPQAPSVLAEIQHHTKDVSKGRTGERQQSAGWTRGRKEGNFQHQMGKKDRDICTRSWLVSLGRSRSVTATITLLTCTQPSKLVRREGQQALGASTVLVEDDRPSLTALRAVTIYCVAEGQQGQHNAQSPSQCTSRQPGTAKHCPQLHTPLHVKRLSSLS